MISTRMTQPYMFKCASHVPLDNQQQTCPLKTKQLTTSTWFHLFIEYQFP